MEPHTLKIGDLCPKWPIIQGGMGVGVSLSGLAGAVAAAGGIGVISAAHPGYNRPGWAESSLAVNLEALRDHIGAATAQGIAGVNIMVASRDYAHYVRCAAEAGAHIIFSGAGLPADLPELVGHSPVKIAPIVSSAKALRVLLTLWERRYERTADLIVIEGPRAGGHLGFSPDEAREGRRFDEEIRAVLAVRDQFAKRFDRPIPAVFGGGIFDRGDIDHILALGCDGVQMSSRFVATDACDAHPDYKAAYIAAGPEDAVIIASPVGMPGRALRNTFVERATETGWPVERCYRCMGHCDPATTRYCISAALIRAVQGDVDNGLVFCGAEVGRIDRMQTVPELMAELTT